MIMVADEPPYPNHLICHVIFFGAPANQKMTCHDWIGDARGGVASNIMMAPTAKITARRRQFLGSATTIIQRNGSWWLHILQCRRPCFYCNSSWFSAACFKAVPLGSAAVQPHHQELLAIIAGKMIPGVWG
jgi:hypothetical protein